MKRKIILALVTLFGYIARWWTISYLVVKAVCVTFGAPFIWKLFWIIFLLTFILDKVDAEK